VWIDHTPKYEQISAKVPELTEKGASVNSIAGALGETWETVCQALDFARTGNRPKTKPSGKRTGQRRSQRKKIDVAEVVPLRDDRHLSFTKIAEQLGASHGTVIRAYDPGASLRRFALPLRTVRCRSKADTRTWSRKYSSEFEWR
jgi:hypothetical protein